MKAARQARDYDGVTEISKRLLEHLETTLGENFLNESSGPRKKRKKKKRLH